MNYCPICNHAAHDATWECKQTIYNVAPEYGCSVPRQCGCTFSAERLKRGEADAAAGRVRPLKDVIEYLRGRYRNGPE